MCYSKKFYENIRQGARKSANEIVPIILKLVQPKNVIDVGCGTGTWLAVFKEHGIDDVWGVDGNWVDKELLEIPKERFLEADLSEPFRLEKKFDLVVSLEVAEHLPSQSAGTFIESLTNLGLVVIFSAAIPFQDGFNHINEQWPIYWVHYFNDQGFQVIDCLRNKIWKNNNIQWWYIQNILMFARNDYLKSNVLLRKEFENTNITPISIVHPTNYLWKARFYGMLKDIFTHIPHGNTLILVDDGIFGNLAAPAHVVIPFLERKGQYWGPSPNDNIGISEIERLRNMGAGFIVFAWPAFWWLEYYSGLERYLRDKFRCVLKNERVIVFNLQSA